MNILLLLIVVILLVNTFLLCKHMKDMKHMKMKEGYFEVDRLSTRYGPTDGPSFCSGMGVRNVTNKNKYPIGDDDSFLFGK